jgi:hypothetical protein
MAVWYNMWPFGILYVCFGIIYGCLGIIYGRLVQFVAIWYNLWPFGIIYGCLVQFVAIWYNFPDWTMKNLATVAIATRSRANPMIASCLQRQHC